MTLEDLLIKINEEKLNVFCISIRKKGQTVLEIYRDGIEKYWEYLADKMLIRKIKYEPGYITIVKLQEEEK